MKKNFLIAALAATTLLAGFVSCSSDDDNGGNNNQIDPENVVEDDASAVSLVNGIYSHWQPLSKCRIFGEWYL